MLSCVMFRCAILLYVLTFCGAMYCTMVGRVMHCCATQYYTMLCNTLMGYTVYTVLPGFDCFSAQQSRLSLYTHPCELSLRLSASTAVTNKHLQLCTQPFKTMSLKHEEFGF